MLKVRTTSINKIPNNWGITKTGNICTSIVPGRNKPKQFNGDIPWITITDLENQFWISESKAGLAVSCEELEKAKGKTVPKGTVIMTCVGNFGIAGIAEKELVINQQLHGFICSEKVIPEYLCHVLRSKEKEMLSLAGRTTVLYLNSLKCESISILLPPITEQRKIAEILAAWDKAIATTEKLIAAKQKRKDFLSVYLLSKNTLHGWQKFKLADLSIKPISYGIVQTGELVKQGIPCVRVIDLTARNLNPQKMITTSDEINQSYKRTILEKGELMIALRGEIGLVRLVDEKLVDCNLTRGVARVSPNKRLILPEYLLWAIRSPLFRDNLLRRVNGSALQEIPIAELRKVIVPVPPIEKQQVIAKILDTAEREIEIIQEQLNLLRFQKRGLMQKLLTGEWRVKIKETVAQLTETKA